MHFFFLQVAHGTSLGKVVRVVVLDGFWDLLGFFVGFCVMDRWNEIFLGGGRERGEEVF